MLNTYVKRNKIFSGFILFLASVLCLSSVDASPADGELTGFLTAFKNGRHQSGGGYYQPMNQLRNYVSQRVTDDAPFSSAELEAIAKAVTADFVMKDYSTYSGNGIFAREEVVSSAFRKNMYRRSGGGGRR